MSSLLPIIVTPSRIEESNRCYRRYFLGQKLRYAKYYSPSLEFGSVVHAGAAAWWHSQKRQGGPNVAGLQDTQIAVSDEWSKRFTANPLISQDSVSLELANGMIRHYVENANVAGPYQGDDWQLVSYEQRIELPLPTVGFKSYLSFQTDRVVYNRNEDRLVVIDLKTASRLDKRWERQWESSLQMKLYKAATAKAYDMDPSRVDVVIEGLLKDIPSSIRYYPCPNWSSGLLEEALDSAVRTATRDYSLATVEDQPRDGKYVLHDALTKTPVNYGDCYSYNKECPFRNICLASPEERVIVLEMEYFQIPEENL